MDSAGNFSVAWQSYGEDSSDYGIYARNFAADGTSFGPQFKANNYTNGFQGDPSLALATAGKLVVAWTSTGQDGSGNGVYAQRFVTTELIATPDSYSSQEGQNLIIAAPGVLANDTNNTSGDPLTAQLVTSPTHGSLSLNPDGSFSYSPVAYYTGPDAFTYRVASGSFTSAPATVSLSVISALVVTLSSDNTAADTFGSFSYALAQAKNPARPPTLKTITFGPNVKVILVNETGSLFPLIVGPGVTIEGNSCANPVTINGNARSSDGLVLTGGTTLRFLKVTNFEGQQIKATNANNIGRNLFECVRAVR